MLWQKRLYLSDKGNADADDDIKKGGPSGTRGGGDERGGGAGAIRSAGGSMGKMAAAQEESYFHKKTMEELEKLHDEMKNELESAGKTAEVERDRDKRVEKKMKELAGHLKEIIEEGKKK